MSKINENNECDIVKDLAIQYVENLATPQSKKFVEEHLQNCSNCKKYYDNVNSNILDNIQNVKTDEQTEIDFMKKTNRYIKIIRNLLRSIVITILLIVLVFSIKYLIITFIVNNTYNRLQELKELNNYKLIEEQTYIDNEENNPIDTLTVTYYYKDGKSKEEFDNSIIYNEDNSNYSISVFNDLKQIDYNHNNYFKQTKGKKFEKEFLEIVNSKNIPLYKMFFHVRKDKYEGINCYVLRRGNNKSYLEVWIDKNTYNILRTVDISYKNYYREKKWYTFENEVTDEDVDASILETDLYKEYKKNR